jgi:hypothetical protein
VTLATSHNPGDDPLASAATAPRECADANAASQNPKKLSAITTHHTGLTSPQTAWRPLCTAANAGVGTFSCTGTIPIGTNAGGAGTHTIKAKGQTSPTKAKTLFLLKT